MKVGIKAIKINTITAKNLPKIISEFVIGFVFKISIVPVWNSSENVFIVIAGTKNNNNHGVRKKKLVRSAKPAFKIFNSSLKTHKNKPLTNKKIPITK